MAAATTRALDGGGAFVVSAPVRNPAHPPCGHGVCVETRFDDPGASPDEISLLLRESEQLDGCAIRAFGEPVVARLSLRTGRCAPRDERAQCFIDAHPWLSGAMMDKLGWLRERACRATAQADRATCMRVLAGRRPGGGMVPYVDLFPADWDLLLVHEGRTYWAVDHHCPSPECTCAEIVVQIQCVDSPTAEHVGQVRLDLQARQQPPKATTPLAAQLFARLWSSDRDELLRRHRDVREALLSRPDPRDTPPRTIARSAPCPCGSGKKFKRCCADRAALANR